MWFTAAPGADAPLLRLRAHAFAGAIDEVTLAWTKASSTSP